MGEEKMETSHLLLKSHGLRGSDFPSAHILCWEFITWPSLNSGGAGKCNCCPCSKPQATPLHEGEVAVGEATSWCLTELITSLLLKNIQAFLDLSASHFSVAAAIYTILCIIHWTFLLFTSHHLPILYTLPRIPSLLFFSAWWTSIHFFKTQIASYLLCGAFSTILPWAGFIAPWRLTYHWIPYNALHTVGA